MTLWMLARAAGFVALAAFTISIVLGASSSERTRPARSGRALDRRILLQFAHRSAGLVGVTMLGAHAALVVVDSYVSVSVLGAIVPFTAGYRAIAVGLGTLAAYLILIAALTGVLRGRLAASPISARGWRSVHRLAYIGFILAIGHGVLAGTDTGRRWSTAYYALCIASVAAAWWMRLGRGEARAARPLALARSNDAHPSTRLDSRGRTR